MISEGIMHSNNSNSTLDFKSKLKMETPIDDLKKKNFLRI